MIAMICLSLGSLGQLNGGNIYIYVYKTHLFLFFCIYLIMVILKILPHYISDGEQGFRISG